MDDKFYNSELLLRAVSMKPSFWKDKENRPSSAIFKDSKGMSVNRTGEDNKFERKASDKLIEQFGKDNVRAVLKIKVSDCNNLNLLLLYKPLSDNEYHSEIHKDFNTPELTTGQARKLAKLCEVIHILHGH